MAIKLLTVPEAAAKLGRTEQQVRYLIFHNVDGFDDRVVVRIGRSVRLREDRVDQLIEEQTGANPFPYSDEWRAKNKAAANDPDVKRRKVDARRAEAGA